MNPSLKSCAFAIYYIEVIESCVWISHMEKIMVSRSNFNLVRPAAKLPTYLTPRGAPPHTNHLKSVDTRCRMLVSGARRLL